MDEGPDFGALFDQPTIVDQFAYMRREVLPCSQNRHGMRLMRIDVRCAAPDHQDSWGPISDIDILVKREHIHQSVQAIELCGYHHYDREDFEQLLNTRYHVVCFNPEINVLSEIHWDITSDRYPSLVRSHVSDLMEQWWSRVSKEVTAFDAHVFHLHPIDLILLLSIHFFKHRFFKAARLFFI